MPEEDVGAGRPRRGQSRGKHVPLRMCVVCREKDAKRGFVRIVRTPDEGLQIDPTGKRNGRGAYLCSRFTCWESAASGSALERALKTELPPTFRAELRQYADEHFRKDDAGRS